jgi:hypothetical protein
MRNVHKGSRMNPARGDIQAELRMIVHSDQRPNSRRASILNSATWRYRASKCRFLQIKELPNEGFLPLLLKRLGANPESIRLERPATAQ